MKRYVLAVDPGGTTGYAWWMEGDSRPAVAEEKPLEFLRTADGWLSALGSQTIVACERFTIGSQTRAKTQQTDALEQIGALRYLASKHGAEFVLQAPADAKRFATDARLKALGWWVPGKGHGMDACRHLLLRLASDGRVDLSQFV